MNKAFTIFIGFLHDFAAGCWAPSVLAVYWVDRIALQRPELKPVLDGLAAVPLGRTCIGNIFTLQIKR